MGSMSLVHWLIVLAVVVVIFGTKKLRNIGSDLGGAVKGFKDAMKDGEEANKGQDTKTIAYIITEIANEQNKTSEGAALSYIILFMVIVLTNLYLYLANRRNQGA